MARPALSTKHTMLTLLLTMPATLALTATPSSGAVWPNDRTDRTATEGHRHAHARAATCSIKAPDRVRKGNEIEALGTGLRPKQSAQLWIEGQKAMPPHRIDKNGHVRMTYRIAQPPGNYPVWITDGVNRCDVPGGITVRK